MWPRCLGSNLFKLPMTIYGPENVKLYDGDYINSTNIVIVIESHQQLF